MRLFSPAKVNLLLAVTGKRDDGFHDLISLVSPLSFGDDLVVEVVEEATGVTLTCSDPSLPADSSNLAYKAAMSFLDAIGSSVGVKVHLEKRIPMEAGLGGGSSNAATVLLALNRLFDSALSAEALSALAAELGSDCPLFLQRKPVVMRGRGEILESLDESLVEQLEGKRLAVFKPGFGVPTGWAYSRLASAVEGYEVAESVEGRLEAWKTGKLGLEDLLFNSFERTVFEKFIPIPALFASIDETTRLRCLMSGSGSACFVLIESDSQASKIESLVSDAWGKDAFFEICRLGSIDD